MIDNFNIFKKAPKDTSAIGGGGAYQDWEEGIGEATENLEGLAGSVMGAVAPTAGMIKDIKKTGRQRMDKRGNTTHKPDALGNITGMAGAGADIGKKIGGPLGMAIGAGAGALVGGVGTVIDVFKQPDNDEKVTRKWNTEGEESVGNISAEALIPKQQLMAEDGMVMENGTKEVEVERDEIVLRKSGRAFKKVADFKGSKTHEQGGEDYVAADGDIIIPRNKARKAEGMLRTRNWKGLESLRMSLPKDAPTKEVYEKGTKGVSTSVNAKPEDWAVQALRAINEVYPNATPKTKQSILANIAHETANGKYSAEGAMTWKNMEDRTDLRTIKGKVNAYMKKHNLTKDEYDKLPSADRISIQYQGETGHGLSGGVGALQTTDVGGDKIDDMRKVGEDLGASSDEEIRNFVEESVYNSTIYSLSVMKERGITSEELNKTDGALDMRKKIINPGETSAKHLDSVAASEKRIAKTFPKLEINSMKGGEAKAEAMREANRKAQGYDDYEKYVQTAEAAGQTPKSRDWYESNVVAPIEEQRQGYWNADTPTGRANYMKEGVHRKDLKPNATTTKIGEDGGTVSQMDLGQFKIGASKGLARDIDKVIEKNISGERGSNPISGFSDPKLEKEAMAFYEYIQESTDNGTWLGRKVEGAFNFMDAAMVEALGGSGQVSTAIANSMGSNSPEEMEVLIQGAIDAGIISEKGSDYVWDVVSNPEAFKSQEAEAVEDINVAMLMKDLPKLLGKGGSAASKAWAKKGGLKGIKEGVGSMLKKGWAVKGKDGTMKLTAKGIKGIRNSKAMKIRTAAAKNSKSGAKRLEGQLKSVFGDSYAGQSIENMDEMEALAKQVKVAGVPQENWSPSMKGAMNFFNNSYKTFKKLPNTIRQKVTGNSYKDIAKMEQNLSKFTGKTPAELYKMDAPEMAKLITDTRKAKFETLQSSIKAKEDLWKTYEPIKKEAELARKSLKKLRANKAVNADELARAEAAVEETSIALEQSEEAIKAIEKSTTQQWDEVAKTKEWMNSGDTPYEWRNLVKGEQNIAKHNAKIKGLEGEMKVAQENSKTWNSVKIAEEGNITSIKGEGAIIDKNIGVLDDIVTQRNTLAKEYQKLAGAQGRAQRAVNAYEEAGPKAAKLHKAILADKEIADAVKAGTMSTVEAYNILRKKGSTDIEGIEEEDVKEFPEDVIKDALEPDPTKPKATNITGPRAGVVEIDPDGVSAEDAEPLVKGEVPAGESRGATIGKAVGGAMESLAAYAPAMYNIAKGLGKVEKVNRNFIAPKLHTYTNMSQDQMNAIDSAFAAAVGNARNLSGGLASNFRANTEKAWADRISRRSQINTMEAQRADQVANQNIGITNRAEEFNAAVNTKADTMDMQSRAARDSFLAQGMSDLQNISGMRTKDRMAAANQEMIMNTMGTEDFKWERDPSGAYHKVFIGGESSQQTTPTTEEVIPEVIPEEVEMPTIGGSVAGGSLIGGNNVINQ